MAKIPTRNFKYTMTNFNIDEPVDIEVHCSVDGLIKIDYVRDLLDQLKNIKGYKFTVFCTVLLMHWDIVNTSLNIPKCVFCTDTTDQMVRFYTSVDYTWICSDCAVHVKDALNKWSGLKSRDYIPDDFTINKSPYLDPLL